MSALVEAVVLAKTKAKNLTQVKNLNLWGGEIRDVTLLDKMPNLEVVSLSLNRIESLEPFQYCKHLREVYLRKNKISSLKEISFLRGLKSLSILWLSDNPVAENRKYRQYVISMLPQLETLDNQKVTDEERKEAQAQQFDEQELGIRTPEKPEKEMPSSQKNILYAVLALLQELDEESLWLVKREADNLLANAANK
mmetsp:Transcript_46367/g.119662  ORF Transcript_46367/g.119662 Transcript_46367/m.119662 type:complete len:196 (-) Transcript_46367:21-608(-)